MLSEISSTQFREWKIYDELDPFGEYRDDLRFASIPFHIRRALGAGGIQLADFLLAFGDTPVIRQSVQQSVEYQERIIDTWIVASNAILTAKGQNRGN